MLQEDITSSRISKSLMGKYTLYHGKNLSGQCRFLLDSFVYYAKKAPPTIATAATFAQIAESKQNLTQGIFCQFLKEYKVGYDLTADGGTV